MKQKILNIIVICLLCIPLAACQATPQNTVVISKNQGQLEEKINKETSETKLFDIPENIKEEVYTKEGKYSIVINADVESLTMDAYPIYSIVPADFRQSEVNTVIKYFFNESPLFAENYTKSKSMIEEEIVQIRADMQNMEQSDIDDIEGAKAAIKKLEDAYDSAPETVTRSQITSKLTIPSDVDYETLDAYVDIGYSELSNIRVANWPTFQFLSIIIDKSRYFLSSALLEGQNAEGQNMTPDEAKCKAEEVLEGLDIKDMTVVRVETGMAEDQFKQGYAVTFKRSVQGVPVAYNTIIDNSEKVDMAAKWPSDLITVRLDHEGVSGFNWSHKGKVQKELSSNVEILPFDEMYEIAKQQLKNKYVWIETIDHELNYKRTVHVDRIALEYMCAQEKDKPGYYILVPAWNFYGGNTLEFENGRTEEEHGTRTDVCILSLNAVNGSVIGS